MIMRVAELECRCGLWMVSGQSDPEEVEWFRCADVRLAPKVERLLFRRAVAGRRFDRNSILR